MPRQPGGGSPDPSYPGGPSDATYEYALLVHQALMDELGFGAGGGEAAGALLHEGSEAAQRRYEDLLAGKLLMHIAGVEPPSSATSVDRAVGVIEALRRIITTPRLLERITGAPYSTDLAGRVGGGVLAAELDEQEQAEAESLRQQIAAAGYLDRSMVTARPIQLEYVTQRPISHAVHRGPKLPAGSLLTVKLAPEIMEWGAVRQFVGRQGFGDTYRAQDFVDTREVPPSEAFRVVAVSTSAQQVVPSKLINLVNEHIDIGSVTTGTGLKLAHDFRLPWRDEVIGRERREPEAFRHLSLPATLQQAYLGSSRRYWLFES